MQAFSVSSLSKFIANPFPRMTCHSRWKDSIIERIRTSCSASFFSWALSIVWYYLDRWSAVADFCSSIINLWFSAASGELMFSPRTICSGVRVGRPCLVSFCCTEVCRKAIPGCTVVKVVVFCWTAGPTIPRPSVLASRSLIRSPTLLSRTVASLQRSSNIRTYVLLAAISWANSPVGSMSWLLDSIVLLPPLPLACCGAWIMCDVASTPGGFTLLGLPVCRMLSCETWT